MTREMQARIREVTKEAKALVDFANPKARTKINPLYVKWLLSRHIPYAATNKPEVMEFDCIRFTSNPLVSVAEYRVKTINNGTWQIAAYYDKTGRTPEQKQDDKTAMFPSGLFKIFHTRLEITA